MVLRQLMDQKLNLAAEGGDVAFLRKAVTSNPPEYFHTFTDDGHGYSILHLAMRSTRCTSFFQVALETLPRHIVPLLLSKQDNVSKWNPLHWAAYMAKLDVICLILDFYKLLLSPAGGDFGHAPAGGKPWLAPDRNYETPLHLALRRDDQRCTLQILSMDVQLLSDMVDKHGSSPLFIAVRSGYSEVALQILNSNHSYSLSGQAGFNPFHFLPKCSEKVWRLLHKKHKQLLHERSSDGSTVLHSWALIGESWPIILLVDNDSLKKLSCSVDSEGNTPLHLAVLKGKQAFARCLGGKFPAVWRLENNFGLMPLELALRQGQAWENLVLDFIFSNPWTNEEIEGCWQRWILIGVQKGMDQVVRNLLRYMLAVIEHSPTNNVPAADHDGQLVVSYGTEEVWVAVLKHPQLLAKLIDKRDENGSSLVHEWARKGEPMLLQLLKEDNHKINLCQFTNKRGDNLLHSAIECGKEDYTISIVEIVGELDPPPWQCKNVYGTTPYDSTLEWRFERLAVLIISKDCWTYTNPNSGGGSRLFTAVDRGMDLVVEKICRCIAQDCPSSVIPTTSDDGLSLLHVLSKCKDTTAALLLDTIPSIMDPHEKETAIDTASQFGEEWLTKLLITKRPSLVKQSPNAWIHLCKRGHLEGFQTFIENHPDFGMLCIDQDDTPLHHIRLSTDKDYEKFLTIPLIMEMKNKSDKNCKTPLHLAFEKEDIRFAEVLLKSGADRSIRDRNRKTTRKLFTDLCEQHYEWVC